MKSPAVDGKKSARMTYLLSGAHVYEHIYMGVLPPIFSLLRQEMGLSYTQLGFLVSARETTYGFLQFCMGYLADKWGHERLLVTGFCGMTMMCLLLGLAPGYYWMVVFQLLSGMFGSTFHPTSFALVADNAPAGKMGKNLALHGLGGMLGSAVVFALIAALAVYLGWRYALVLVALPGFVLCFILGKILLGKKTGSKEEAAAAGDAAAVPSRTAPLFLLLITQASVFVGMCNRSLAVFLPAFLNEFHGFSLVEAGLISSLFFVCAMAGSLLGGYLTDRFDRVHLIFFSSIVTALFIYLICFTHFPDVLLFFLLAVLGVIRLIPFPSINALAADFSAQGSRGAIYGFVFGGSFGGGALAIVVLGYLADLYGIVFSFYILSLLAVLMGLAVLVFKFIKYK